MKRIFTFLVFVLSAFIARAGRDDGRVSITNLSLDPVRVEIDGKNYTNARDGQFFFNNMMPGNHSVKIYRQQDRPMAGGSIAQNVRKQLIFASTVFVKARFHVDIVINRFGKALIDEQFMDDRYQQWYGNGNNDNNGYNNDRDNRNDRDYDNQDRYNRNPPAPRPMNDQAFAALLETLRHESFESTRLTLTKQVVDKNLFITDQVRQLMQLYAFDDRKVDLAKYMYRNTLDKENYFQLYQLLTFSSSKENLAAFIRDYR